MSKKITTNAFIDRAKLIHGDKYKKYIINKN